MALIPVKLKASGPGWDTVEIGGVDILPLGVKRVTVDTVAGFVPTVFVETVNDVDIEVEGVVMHNVGVDGSSGAAIAAWLAEIDPAELDQAVVNAEDGMETSFGSSALKILASWAEHGRE